jgi:hypothetical protein
MGKLMKRAGRALGTGVLVLAGAMVLMLAGTGIAHAQPASTSVCKKINATLASLNATFKAYSTTPKKSAATIASQLTQAASTGSPAVKSAVSTFDTDLEAGVAAGHLDLAKLNADADVIAIASCAPSGAPATGGGSAAGSQDPALFGVGGAAVLAGIVVLCLALRSRPRTGVGHG